MIGTGASGGAFARGWMMAPMGSAAFVFVPVDMGMALTVMRINLGWHWVSALSDVSRDSHRIGSASSSGSGLGVCSGSGMGAPDCVPGGLTIDKAWNFSANGWSGSPPPPARLA
jgi:hypothetical protein